MDDRQQWLWRLRILAFMPVWMFVWALSAAETTSSAADPNAWMRNGRAALEDGQYALAEKWFRQGLAESRLAEAAEARLGLAKAFYGAKNYSAMLESLPISGAPGAGQPQAAAYRYYRALALHEMGSHDEALAELDDPAMAGDAGPLAADAGRLKAWILLRQAKWPEAERAFTAWEAMPVADLQKNTARLEWADALASAARFEEAELFLRRVLAQDPVPIIQWKARRALARALIGLNRGESAEKELDVLTGDTNVSVNVRLDAWLTRSELEEVRTNWQAACSAASNAVELASTPADQRRARTALGRVLLRGGFLREGSELLQSVIAADPGDPQSPALQLAVARAFLDAGRHVEAERQFRFYLESFTNAAGVVEASEGRAWALLGIDRFAEAAADFEKAAEKAMDPVKRSRMTHKSGDAYFANGQFQLAAERYRKVFDAAADPTLVREADFQLAETEARLGRSAEARAHFAKIETKEPGSEWAERASLRMAELLQESGALIEAGAAYDRFLTTYSNSARWGTARYNRGLVAYQLYRFDQALADFESILAKEAAGPHGEDAAYMRVCTAFELYNDARAEQWASDFLNARPGSTWAPQVRFRVAEYQFNRSAYERAEEQFKLVADLWPKDPLAADALFWAARSAAARKQYKRAVELDTDLIKNYPDHPKVTEAMFYQAEALVVLGDYTGAVELLDDVIRRQPDSFLAYAAKGRRGDAQFTLGADDPAKFEEAIRSYAELADNSKAPFELRLQAAFKIGRARQKLGRLDEAFEQYYRKVMLVFLDARQGGMPMNEACTAWFTQAAFEGAGIMESRGKWREAVRMYQRVAEAGVAAAGDAQRRIESIQREHWRFF